MLKKKITNIIALLLAITIVFGFAGCGGSSGSSSNTESKIDKIKKAGKLVLGTSADYPPYEFHKSINGSDQIVGFDIDIAQEIAKDLGVKLEIKDMDFKGLLNALDAGKVDLVLSGMTPTPERAKSVDFSTVYYKAVQTVVVRAEDKDKLKTANDLKGKNLGVQKGSIQEDIAKNQIPGAKAKALSKISDIVLALNSKKFDAAIIEGPVATSYVNANKNLVISELKLKTEDAGSAAAVKKGNKDLVDAVNKTLKKLMDDKSIDSFVAKANKLVE